MIISRVVLMREILQTRVLTSPLTPESLTRLIRFDGSEFDPMFLKVAAA